MNSNRIYILSLLTITLVFSSCFTAIIAPTGIKSIRSLDEESLITQADSWHIPAKDVYELDTTYYTFIKQKTKDNDQVKNRLSPLQALYYDQSNALRSYQTSAFALGYPNLKWNRNNTFETFLPKLQTPIDTLLDLAQHLKFFNSTNQTETFDPKAYDYIIVVYWNKFMGRQSKKLIKHVQKNTELAKATSVKILYVNNDNFYRHLMDNNQSFAFYFSNN